MIGTGIFEDETDEGTIGWWFGTLAAAYSEREAGKNYRAIFQEISEGYQMPYIQYFYGAHMAYCKLNKIKKEVDVVETARIMEKLGPERCVEIYTKSMEALISKNGKAPEETGQVMDQAV